MNDAGTLFSDWKERPDPETLIALLRHHQDSVYNLCWQVLRHTHDAEDAAQKVFSALIPVLPTLSSDDRLRAWLYRASLLTALNLRSSQRRRMNHERNRPPLPPPSLSESEMDVVHEQIAQLRDDLRTLVVRHYFERRTLAELADSDGCSSVAIWKRLQKAHEALRRSLVRAGLASIAVALLPFLESREAIAAPANLVSEALVARSRPGPAAPAGTLVALKVSIVVAVLGTALLGYGVHRRRHDVPLEVPPVATSTAPPARASALLPRPTPVAETPAAAEDALPRFRTGKAFWLAYHRAIALDDDARRWRALRRLGLRRSDRDLARAWANATAAKVQRERPMLILQKIFEDWLLSDPESVAAFALGLPFDRSTNFYLVVTLGPAAQAWGEADPGAAAAFLKRLPPMYNVSEFAQGIELRARFRSDPDAYIAWLKTLSTKAPELYEATRIAVADWASKDPASAVSWIGRQPTPLQERAFQTITDAWGASRPWIQKCSTALQQTRDIAEAAQSLAEQFLTGVAELDPDWTPERSSTWDRMVFRPLVLSTLTRLAEEDPSAAARMVETLSFDAWTVKAVDAIVQPWAQSDPRAALEWLKRQPFKSIHEQETVAILRLWAASDPESALRAAEGLSEWARVVARMGIVDTMAQKDPAAAVRFCESFPTPPPDPHLGRLAGTWAQVDLEAALAWARGLPHAGTRDAALEAVVTVLPDDPDRAFAVAGEISNADQRQAVIDRIITDLAGGDPQGAVEALKRFPDALPRTVQQIAQNFAFLNPAAGMAWAATLPEEHRHTTLRSIVIQSAVRKDMEPLRRWIEQSDLSPADRKEFLALIRRSEREK